MKHANQVGVTLLYLALALAVSVAPLQAQETTATVKTIDVGAARDYVAEHADAIIVDVRTPAEFEMSHIPGAINVDVQDDNFAALVQQLDKDKTYVVHCTKNPAGGRSSRALETLQQLGFRNLYNLEGGYIAWQEAALPLTEGKTRE